MASRAARAVQTSSWAASDVDKGRGVERGMGTERGVERGMETERGVVSGMETKRLLRNTYDAACLKKKTYAVDGLKQKRAQCALVTQRTLSDGEQRRREGSCDPANECS